MMIQFGCLFGVGAESIQCTAGCLHASFIATFIATFL